MEWTQVEIEAQIRVAIDRSLCLLNKAEKETPHTYWQQQIEKTKALRDLFSHTTILTVLNNIQKQEQLQHGPRSSKS